MPISLNPIKFIYLSNLGLFQTFLISWSYLLTLDLSPTPGCLNEVSKMQIWLCSRPTCKFCSGCPLPLASSSSSLACLHSPWWSLPAHLSDQIHAPHHHLHLRTQIGSTKPCRGPHTPCSSGCMLLFITALGDSVSFFLPPRWPLAASSLLSVSVDLPIPDISKQQNHTLHGPLRLASLACLSFSLLASILFSLFVSLN